MTGCRHVDDQKLLENKLVKAKSRLYNQKQHQKIDDDLTYIGCNISSIKTDVNM